MHTKDEALKMAIEAFDAFSNDDISSAKFMEIQHKAIQACKEALEQPAKNIRDSFNEMLEDKVAYYKGKQPAQEPVAWMDFDKQCYNNSERDEFIKDGIGDGLKPLYTHPAPSWQGLSDDEIYTMRNANTQFYFGENHTDELKFARAIEQALKEKNHG